tara:strand:- start:841 stop:1050 length:210 start_codon:yes stop_codon:yes gene_type:complete
MEQATKEILQDAYDGYSKSLQGADEFIQNHEAQLKQAKEHRDMMQGKIETLKELLEITDESEESEESEG